MVGKRGERECSPNTHHTHVGQCAGDPHTPPLQRGVPQAQVGFWVCGFRVGGAQWGQEMGCRMGVGTGLQ